MIIKARPTTYAGARFRSRLEARWAAFFDLCGWRWEYEPVDAEGWVPDFLLIGKARAVPVEVKPINWIGATESEFMALAKDRDDLGKLAGTRDEILVLGCYPAFISYDEPILGVLWNESGVQPSCLDLALVTEGGAGMRPGQLDFQASNNSFHLRLSGEYDGGHPKATWGVVGDLWRRAGTATQWRGR